MGGAAGPYHSQQWDANKLANFVWNKFLGGRDSSISRPFGDIRLDGVDFDPEGKKKALIRIKYRSSKNQIFLSFTFFFYFSLLFFFLFLSSFK